MTRWSALALLAFAGVASAAPVRGQVETTSSRWSGDMIVTDIVVRAADGTRTTIVEHGGSVDGVGMWVSHRDATLKAGDEVEVTHDRYRMRAHRVGASAQSIARSDEDPSHANGVAGPGVQRTSRSQRALYHPTACLNFQYDAKGSTKIDSEWSAFDAAFTAWEGASANHACGGVSLSGTLVQNAPDGHDGINTIHFRDTKWCRPSNGSEAETCHSPDAVAVTRVLYVDEPFSPRDGEILEVDIDVNAVDFTFGPSAIDLQSAATHEIGHALGLDHNCGVEDGAWPSDRDGQPVPSCESVSADLANATMYVQVQPGSTTMRAPKPSDVDGLCSSVGGTCIAEVTGGCSTSGGSSGGLVVVLAALLWRRRRATT